MTTRQLALLTAATCLLAACPTTQECEDDETFNGSECVPFDGGNVDAGSDGGGDETDVPCGGGCASGVCDPAANACVECIEGNLTACEDGENACVGNTCVGCAVDGDCTALTAPECGADNSCGNCTSNDACMDRTDTTVCDLDSGACVECTSNAQCTGTNEGCDLSTHTCETYVPMGATLCGPCLADAHCPMGQVCAPTEFPVGSGTEVGNFCLWRQDAAVPGPMGACSRVPPYRIADPVTTVDGDSATVCAPGVSTCTALRNFLATPCGTAGTTPPTTPDPTCGIADVDDGFCRVRDSGSNRCTVECTTYDDCPCTVSACARQYNCIDNRCDFSSSCDVTTGVCS